MKTIICSSTLRYLFTSCQYRVIVLFKIISRTHHSSVVMSAVKTQDDSSVSPSRINKNFSVVPNPTDKIPKRFIRIDVIVTGWYRHAESAASLKRIRKIHSKVFQKKNYFVQHIQPQIIANPNFDKLIVKRQLYCFCFFCFFETSIKPEITPL